MVTYPFFKFWNPNHIFGMGEAMHFKMSCAELYTDEY